MSPLVPGKKKDGWTRWVADLRELNKQTIKDSFPLMNIQEILHSLQGATTVFSSLDLYGAYHAVRIEPGSHASTAFISPFGTFQYICMPFGLANTGSVFYRMLYVAIKEVERDFWMSYLNDILTYSRESWAQFRHLLQVVLAHAVAGIKIQPCKTKLFQSKVEYLGHKISKRGVSMILEYVQKIKDWPVPKSGKEIATFLGFTGYYLTFIPLYSALTNWLNGIKMAEKFLLNEDIEQDFVELKKVFTDG